MSFGSFLSDIAQTIFSRFWRMQPANYRAEVGYLLHSDYWKQGFAFEALQAVLKYGFEVMNCNNASSQADEVSVCGKTFALDEGEDTLPAFARKPD